MAVRGLNGFGKFEPRRFAAIGVGVGASVMRDWRTIQLLYSHGSTVSRAVPTITEPSSLMAVTDIRSRFFGYRVEIEDLMADYSLQPYANEERFVTLRRRVESRMQEAAGSFRSGQELLARVSSP